MEGSWEPPTETERRASRSTFPLLPAMPAVTRLKKTPRPPSGGILHVPEGTGRLHKFRNDIRKVMPSCYAIVIGSGLRNIQSEIVRDLWTTCVPNAAERKIAGGQATSEFSSQSIRRGPNLFASRSASEGASLPNLCWLSDRAVANFQRKLDL